MLNDYLPDEIQDAHDKDSILLFGIRENGAFHRPQNLETLHEMKSPFTSILLTMLFVLACAYSGARIWHLTFHR